VAVRVQSKPTTKPRLASEQILRRALDVRNELLMDFSVLVENLA
jgi:hypothetical protein